MTLIPEDEWFTQDDSGGSMDKTRQPAEDDWLTMANRAPRTPVLDLLALNSSVGLAAIGLIVIAVVALVGVVLAFNDPAPPAGYVIPIPSVQRQAVPVSQTPASASPARNVGAPTTTLKPGDSGPQVKTLQRELNALGYLSGGMDGSYGTQTTKAVMAFQRAHHLTVDGVVGPTTLGALAP